MRKRKVQASAARAALPGDRLVTPIGELGAAAGQRGRLLLALVLLAGASTCFAYWIVRPEVPIRSESSTETSPLARRGHATAAVDAWKRLVAINFAGDQACAECHSEIYRAHQRSGHSHTATAMVESELGQRLLNDGTYQDPQRGQTFAFFAQYQQFWVRDESDTGMAALPVNWLLGSGKHAQTPIAVDPTTQRGVELRWSYLTHQDTVGVTPDQERFATYQTQTVECYGRPMDSDDVRTCLGCHTTVGPPAPLPPHEDLYIPNVGCERCHGPRKKHVELAQQGHAADAQPLVQYETAEAYMAACSQCHRDEQSVSLDAAPHELVRFQPYGLERSRCFQAAPEQMTCSACHDPHDAVSRDRQRYVTHCQTCHQPSSPQQCAAEPAGDCVECHMPAVEWTAGISFHDHWIRVPTQ